MRSWVATSPKETAEKVIGWLPKVMESPCDAEGLEQALLHSENHILKDGDEAVAWIAITPSDIGNVMDIAVQPSFNGKWLTRSVIREAGEFIFKQRDFVLLERSKGRALKFALRMGANPIMIPGRKDTYLLSEKNFSGRLH